MSPWRLGVVLAWIAAAACCAGCRDGNGTVPWPKLTPASAPAAGPVAVPAPIHLLLPRQVRIHPFTGTRTFGGAGGARGIEVRVEVLDAFGDPTKAFGDFRFELSRYRSASPDPRGTRVAVWQESLLDPQKNLVHWDNITRTYEFKLQCERPIPSGQRFVLDVVFSSPFTERLFARRTDVSGE